MERWLLPEPEEMMKATQSLCADQAKSALLAWHYKKQGRAKEEVLALIPESPKALTLRITSAMRENVEDAYLYPELSQYTYYSFRSEAWKGPPKTDAMRLVNLNQIKESKR
jgi:hypothetical protein